MYKKKLYKKKKNNNGKTDNIYKGIISKKRKVNFVYESTSFNV